MPLKAELPRKVYQTPTYFAVYFIAHQRVNKRDQRDAESSLDPRRHPKRQPTSLCTLNQQGRTRLPSANPSSLLVSREDTPFNVDEETPRRHSQQPPRARRILGETLCFRSMSFSFFFFPLLWLPPPIFWARPGDENSPATLGVDALAQNE